MNNPTFTHTMQEKRPIDCIREQWQQEDKSVFDEMKGLRGEFDELFGIVIYGGTP